MTQHVTPPRGRPSQRTRLRGEDEAFDVWIAPALHSLFDHVAAEPAPPELLALLEAAARPRPSPRLRDGSDG